MQSVKTTIIVHIYFITESERGYRTHDTEVMRLDLDEHADTYAAREFARKTAREMVGCTNGYNGHYVSKAAVQVVNNWNLKSDVDIFENDIDINATVTVPCM